jgi:Holliday junction resolvase
MGRLSRNKGKTGERELAHELRRVLGVIARRGVQYTGGAGSPDVVTEIDSIHIECKRTEHFRLFEALEQSIRDAGESQVPVVMHRPNHRPWIVVLRLDDLPVLVETISKFQRSKNNDQQN